MFHAGNVWTSFTIIIHNHTPENDNRFLEIIRAASRQNLSSGFPISSDTNWVEQPQKIATGLKFRVEEVVELFYLCSENKGADQWRGYRAADLYLCFRISISHLATHV